MPTYINNVFYSEFFTPSRYVLFKIKRQMPDNTYFTPGRYVISNSNVKCPTIPTCKNIVLIIKAPLAKAVFFTPSRYVYLKIKRPIPDNTYIYE